MQVGRFGILIAALVVAPASPLLAQSQAFTTDDMLQVEWVSEPAFTPDGNHITYVVTSPGDGETTQSDLWTVSWQGGDAHAVQATLDRDESAPTYNADGTVLAFLRSGKDDEPTQLWISEAGAAARKVTTLPGGVDSYTLSPDGRSAVVVSEVGVHVGQNPDVPPPVVIDRFIIRQDGRGWLDDRRAQMFRVDLASGDAVQITSGDYDNASPAWSPDGQWIAFVSKRCEDADRHYCTDIYVMSPQGGEPRRISTFKDADSDMSGEFGRPQWSPDSSQLVWTRAGDESFNWYTPYQLVTADLATGTERNVAWIDRWVYFPRWSADGKTILALVEQDRDTWLARIDPASDRITYLTSGSRFAYGFAASPNGRIAVLDGDSNTPTALMSVEQRPRTLSPQNAWVAGRRLSATQDVSFMSGDTEIHGQLLLPPDHQPGQRHPLVVRLHGGPVYQFSHEFMGDWQVFAANGYAVLGINPRGSSGRGAAFAQEQMAAWGSVDVEDISAGISHVLDMGVADPDAIGVGGWSYGGILTDYMIAREPRIKAAVSGAGMANFFGGYGVDQYSRDYELELGRPWENVDRWMELSYPFFKPETITAPTLFLCSEVDWNVPCTGSQQLYQVLHSLDVPTRLVVYPGQTHSLSVPSYIRDRMERELGWYDFYLKGEGEGGAR
ncbi:S9 family peptidase [Alteraurantiacibacter aestuarii]